jgi:hypothetical protein
MLRGTASDASDFVDELFDVNQHALIFEDFLNRTDGLPLFVVLLPSRNFNMVTAIPKTGSYVSFLYMLKPSMSSEAVTWTDALLRQKIQVQFSGIRDTTLFAWPSFSSSLSQTFTAPD